MRILIISGFVLMVVAQWYAPLSMIFDARKTIDEGTEYKFKTAPVDPSDPFRGKYVTLNFGAETFLSDDTTVKFENRQKVYVVVAADSAGFAEVVQVLAEPPATAADYFQATYLYGDRRMSLEFPFDRFYLEESKASEAEKVYWESNRAGNTMNCYARVSIHDGNATLTDVMIDDRSIIDIVRELNASED